MTNQQLKSAKLLFLFQVYIQIRKDTLFALSMSNALNDQLLVQDNASTLANSLAPAIALDDGSESISLSDSPRIKQSKASFIGYEYDNLDRTNWNVITITLCITYIIISTQMPFYVRIIHLIYAIFSQNTHTQK